MTKSLLIIDDEKHLADNLQRYFRGKGMEVSTAYDGASGIRAARESRFDAVILDLRLPDMSGLEVLVAIKEHNPGTGVVMFTAYGDVATAVKAIQQKADNFVLKPVDLKVLDSIVNRVLQSYQSREDLSYLKDTVSRLRGGRRFGRLLLPPAVAETAQLLADNPGTNVLILGETGTGKGVLASAIHEASNRREAQLVDINCAGLSDTLLESELFGHEKGAFTDAKAFKRGLLEVADRGSLFLDEVGELPLAVQARLLKVIEDQIFRRVGGTSNVRVDVRIMAATNSNLESAAEQGSFRKDLFFRLNVMPLTLPPLRDRADDILPLANRFLDEFSKAFNKDIEGYADESEPMLQQYRWPGNIRELRNVIERAVLLCHDRKIRPAHLPDNMRAKPRSKQLQPDTDWSLTHMESEHIARVLEACDQNRSQAARLLGIHRATLIKKIKKYGF